MAKVIWSKGALGDAYWAAEYIAQDSPDQASLFVERLHEAVKRLEDFPASGRRIPEAEDPAFREIIVGPYRVMYEVGDMSAATAGVHGSKPDVKRRRGNVTRSRHEPRPSVTNNLQQPQGHS